MHYVRFTGTKDEQRGDFEEIVRYEDKAGAVGIVAALREALEEIDPATYAAEKAAIKAHNTLIPPPTAPVDTPREAIAAVLAKADGDITAAEVKAIVLFMARRLFRRSTL